MKIKTLISAISLSLALPAICATEATVFNNELELAGMQADQAYQLRLNLPGETLKTITLQPAEAIRFSAGDFNLAAFPDGHYKYELVPFYVNTKKVRSENQEKARLSGTKAEKISGSFMVKNGQTVVDQDETSGTRDQFIGDDLIVNGSACIGFDCVNGENFGFDTLRLKENNLRIKFQDTSTSASFPSNDWELTANDSSNGGGNYFGITDATSGQRPFSVEAGAKNHSLYVENTGDIGFGTSTPAVKNHLVDGDTPTVRLEQNGSFGWTPQTWDVAGNEANFFIRDVTNGSKLPFRIRPGAPTSSIDIAADGKIGIGDSSPDAQLDIETGNLVVSNGFIGIGTDSPLNKLHIVNTAIAGITLENTTAGTSWKFVNKDNLFSITKVGTGSSEFQVFDDGAMIIGKGGAIPNFDMDASGNVTIQGTLMQNSDINSKENISAISTSLILDKVMSLPITIWNYKFDKDNVKHLGPMAQDFFAVFGLGSTDDKIATIDTSGVALASIQELGMRLKTKDDEIKELKASNKILNARLLKLEEIIKKGIDRN